MLMNCGQKDIFINTDLITRVANNGEDGLEIFYAGDAKPEYVQRQTFDDAGYITTFFSHLRKDRRFIGLGAGPHGPTEYVNFAHVRRVNLENGKATIYLPDGQRSYDGHDRDAIAARIGSRLPR